MGRSLALIFSLLAAGLGTGSAQGQASPCDDAAFRAFDFWVGEWIVRDADGKEVGRNRIRRVSGGCALLESWSSSRGTTGTSLNFYDPASGRWTQVWVGGRGLRLHLVGGTEDGAMVLSGERTVDGERVRDRITWTPMPDGRVRQTWETAPGDGDWEKSWEGFYHRAENGSSGR